MTYVALLRGINVTGKNPLRMEALREMFARLGHHDVETYVQSGNVIFRGASAKDLGPRIEARLRADFGYEVPTLVLTAAELAKVFAGNPFLAEPAIDPAKLHVTFLERAPAAAQLARLAAIPAGRDRYAAQGKVLYLHTPDGYGRTKLSNTAIERALETRATTRNWKTVTALHGTCEARR